MLSVMSTLSNVDIKTLPSGPAARSAPKNFSTESEKFSGAAPAPESPAEWRVLRFRLSALKYGMIAL